MDGYVAVTDPGWYERLLRTPGPKDANFWRPSARPFARLEVGTPFLFKLNAPHNAIAGFGYLAGFTSLPDWLAWDTFGEANGVESLAALRSRVSSIQEGPRIQADPGGRIGCCLIAESQFFPSDSWVRTPSDWSPRTQTGAGYALASGEGARVWLECQARAVAGATGISGDVLVLREPVARYGAPALHVPRLGQGIFRVKVLDAYGRACAVTGEHSLPVLEAAHIKPYASGGEHAVANGLPWRLRRFGLSAARASVFAILGHHHAVQTDLHGHRVVRDGVLFAQRGVDHRSAQLVASSHPRRCRDPRDTSVVVAPSMRRLFRATATSVTPLVSNVVGRFHASHE